MASSKSSRSSDAIVAALRAVLTTHVAAGQRVVVGLSGGRDSIVLIHALSKLHRDLAVALSAIHVHHGLSPNADAWETFCRQTCADLDVPVRVHRLGGVARGDNGLEAAARDGRYAAFAQLETDWIALAHHRGDQAETVLHRLLRGAGVRGLSGMRVVRELPHSVSRARVIRPLLSVGRTEIEAYAHAHELVWVDDESNADWCNTRNFLRGAILPQLTARFPAAEQAIARAAEQLCEADALLDGLARDDIAALSAQGRLRLEGLRGVGAVRARNLLRYLLREAGLRMPDADTLNELQRQLFRISNDAQFSLVVDDVELRSYRGELHFLRGTAASVPFDVEWQRDPQVSLPTGVVSFEHRHGAGFSQRLTAGWPLRLASRRGGERIQPDAARPRRTLKHLYQELGVPPWQRERRPVLWCGDRVVWVPDVGIDVAFRSAPDEPGWVPAWRPNAG